MPFFQLFTELKATLPWYTCHDFVILYTGIPLAQYSRFLGVEDTEGGPCSSWGVVDEIASVEALHHKSTIQSDSVINLLIFGAAHPLPDIRFKPEYA
jgi:hypothetical protein